MNLPTLPTPDRKNIPFMVLAGVPILIIALAILNYFNIVPLSQKWPNLFSILPHLPPKPITLKTAPITAVKEPIVTTNSSGKVATKTTTEQLAKESLDKMIQSYINPGYRTDSSKVFNISPKTAPGTVFVTSWTTKDQISLQLFARYDNKGVLSPDRQIFIGLPKGKVQSLDAKLAYETARQYLSLQVSSNFTCSKVNTNIPDLTLCESKWTGQDNLNMLVQVEYPI